jgi:hypothetical protein
MKTQISSTLKFALFSGILFISTSMFAQPGDMFIEPIDWNGIQADLMEPEFPTPIASPASPKIQVVFALDVTGSMSGLLSAAKEKIWSIASTLAQTENTPEISMGVVAYRDRGDAFVTKIIDLNQDLDLVYDQLMKLSANGGGDSPESVNQGLYDAVTRISWDDHRSTIKTVYLVGDCPPHMDYRDDIKYQETCVMATQEDIVINTIQMGDYGATTPIWQEIASLSHGEFFRAGYDAGSIAVATPYDDEIKRKTAELEKSKVFFGTEEEIAEKEATKQIKVDNATTMSSSSAARRAEYTFSDAGAIAVPESNEIIENICSGTVTLTDIAVEELPAAWQAMEDEDLEIMVDDMVEERQAIKNELDTMIRARADFLDKNITDEVNDNSLTNNILKSMKKQAKKKDVKLSGHARY